MNFVYKESKSKEKLFCGGRGGGARVSDLFTKTLKRKKILGAGGTEGLEKVIFFTKYPNLKYIYIYFIYLFILFFAGGGGWGWGRGRVF